MHISACILDSNEFSAAVLMFPESGYKTRLLQKQLDVWISKEAELALSNFQLTNDIVNSQLIHTLGGLRSSLVVLPDPENIGITVGISFISCIQDKIYIISSALPVNGRHLRIPTYPDV